MIEQTSTHGERLGNYIVELELERTATAVTWRARHQVLPRRAAIKVMADAHSILHEACILEALLHPGIVRVYETGLLRDRRAWFARELALGAPFERVIAPGAIDRADAVGFLRDLADVLAHAHERGVVNAGLHPGAIVVTGRRRGFPIVIKDWSAACAHDAPPRPYDGTPATAPYASPEQLRGDAICDRTDVFALGVMAYQLLTGALPVAQHVLTEVHCPDAPRELTSLVDQMLAYNRWDRPTSGEVRDALAAHLASTIVRARKPRFTPELTIAQGTRDHLEQVLDAPDEPQVRR